MKIAVTRVTDPAHDTATLVVDPPLDPATVAPTVTPTATATAAPTSTPTLTPTATALAPTIRWPYGRHSVDPDDIAAVIEVLESDHLTCGPEVGRFEDALAAYLGAPQVTVCSNGTAALHLAYAALDLGAGDEIITSPITFSATASAAYQVGATVRFADVDPRSGNLDLASVTALIGPRTRAITAVHLGGLPTDLDELAALALRHDLYLIEDACHALGATYRGKLVASGAADAAVLSFHPVKHIASGEGGAVILRDREHHRRAQRLRNHGVEREPSRLLAAPPAPAPWYYEVVEQGFNYRLPDILCALGRSQLTRLPGFLSGRRTLAAAYRRSIAARFGGGAGAPVRAPATAIDRESAYHLFAVAIDFAGLGIDERSEAMGGGGPAGSAGGAGGNAPRGNARGRVMTALAARGIGTQVHYIPLPYHPFHRQRAGAHADWPRPGADHYYQRTLSLPMYPGLDAAAADTIVAALAHVLEELR